MMSFSYRGKLRKKLNKCTYRPIWSEFSDDPSVVVTAVAVLAQHTRFANAHPSGFFALTAVSLLGLTLFHGMAHALEMPVGSVTVGFASGVAVAMTALFGIGASMMTWVAKQTTERPTTQFTQWLDWLPAVLSSLGAMLVLFNA